MTLARHHRTITPNHEQAWSVVNTHGAPERVGKRRPEPVGVDGREIEDERRSRALSSLLGRLAHGLDELTAEEIVESVTQERQQPQSVFRDEINGQPLEQTA